MSAAAVTIEDIPPLRREAEAFVAAQERARYCAWRELVEKFKANEGGRAVLTHVPDERWAEHFAANDDAYTSVVEELQRFE